MAKDIILIRKGVKSDFSERVAEVETKKAEAKWWRRETSLTLVKASPRFLLRCLQHSHDLHKTPCSTTTVTLASGVGVTPMTSALQRAAAEEKRTQPTLRVATLGRPELEQPSVTIELRFKTGGRLLNGFVFEIVRALRTPPAAAFAP